MGKHDTELALYLRACGIGAKRLADMIGLRPGAAFSITAGRCGEPGRDVRLSSLARISEVTGISIGVLAEQSWNGAQDGKETKSE